MINITGFSVGSEDRINDKKCYVAFSMVPDLFGPGLYGIKMHKAWKFWEPTPNFDEIRKLNPTMEILSCECGTDAWVPLDLNELVNNNNIGNNDEDRDTNIK